MKSAAFWSVSLLAGCALSCAMPAGVAVHDLAAIHDPENWTPRSPAPLSIAPGDYFRGYRVETPLHVGNQTYYPVEDHRALEDAILARLGRIPPGDYGTSLEATGWLVIELLADEAPEARQEAAAVLADYAGWWVDHAHARLPATEPSGDLAAAVADYTAAVETAGAPDFGARAAAALQEVDHAALGDPLQAARLVAGLARRYRSAPEAVTGRGVLARIGLRTVLLALERGEGDSDPSVAEACRSRRALILRFAAPSAAR